MARRVGRPITPDQARALNLPSQMLGQMIAETALDENARQMRLGLSDAEIAKRITTDPTFRGPTGQFDRNRFEQIIRQAGYNEGRFVAEQRRITLRREIAETIAGGLTVPQTALELQHRFRNEERAIDYIALDRAQAGDVPAPSPEALNKYFDERKVLFRAPEYRKLDLLVLSPQDTSRWTEVSDADARKAYDDRRARYVTPERREVQQIVFPNAGRARARPFDKIGQGTTFEQIAAERGVKDTDMNLGMVTKAGMLDSAVADAAFSLEPGKVSEPVTGRFGTVLLRVGKIEPEKVRPFEEVANEIKREVAAERAKAQIADQHIKVEDERGAGQPLAEIAKKLNLAGPPHRGDRPFGPRSDRQGRDRNSAQASTFSRPLSRPMSASKMIRCRRRTAAMSGSRWFGTTPSRERPLSEVQDRVVERWREDEIAARLKTKAAELADKLKTATVNDVATAAGLKAQSAKGLKRGAVSGCRACQGRQRRVCDAEGWRREFGRRPADLSRRVSRHGYQRAEIRSGIARGQAARERAAHGRIRGSGEPIYPAPASRSRHDRQRNRLEPGADRRRAKLSAGMRTQPPIDLFSKTYDRGDAQVVWTTLVADLETPVSAFLKIAGGKPMSFLLESVEGGAVRGRYSIIGLEPDLVFRVQRPARRDQPRRAPGIGCVHALRSSAAAGVARPDRGKPHRTSG